MKYLKAYNEYKINESNNWKDENNYSYLVDNSILFSELIKQYPELMDIEYKKGPISKIAYNYGYTILPEKEEGNENSMSPYWMDYQYNDYKAYRDIKIVDNKLASAYQLYVDID